MRQGLRGGVEDGGGVGVGAGAAGEEDREGEADGADVLQRDIATLKHWPSASMGSDSLNASVAATPGDMSQADSESPLVRLSSERGASTLSWNRPATSPVTTTAVLAGASTLQGQLSDSVSQTRAPASLQPQNNEHYTVLGATQAASSQHKYPTESKPTSRPLPQVNSSDMNLDPETDKDQKFGGPTHTLEILDSKTASHNKPLSKSKKMLRPFKTIKTSRRRFLREPITTITSSMGRKRNGGGQNNNVNSVATSAAGLLSHTQGTSSSPNNGGLLNVPGNNAKSSPSMSDLASKSSSSPPGSAVDSEHGINDINGTHGILHRVYDSWSLISLTIANIGPVAGAFFGVHTAKEYGGYSMLAIGWPLSGLCMCLFSAVLAELSSSYPVAGAMFTWTFRTCRLSPRLRPFARYLSWLCGSLLLCGHILSQMLLEYQIATVLQGLIIIFAKDYQPSTWRTILLAWGCLLVSACLAANRLGRSPWLWKGVSLLVACTVVILIVSVFACTTYRNPATFIFTSYRNETGWTSKGYVYLLGWVLTSIATGQDVAPHLAEEAKQPTKTVPIGVFWGTAISYLIGWVVMLCIMAVTPEVPHGQTPTRDYGAPAQMLTEILPRPLAFVILLLIVILMIFQDTAQLLASSRFMWALARDSAIPFSPYLRRLTPESRLPIRATWTVCAIAAPCLLLIAGSKQIVTSLILSGCGSSLVLAYLTPVLCYLSCPKGALDTDGRNEWTLRGASRYVAAFGSCYVMLIIVMMCCPNFYPVTNTSFSYAAPVLIFVLFLSSLTWIFYGNSHYAGPIKSITVYTIGREVELPKLTSTSSTNRQTPHSGKPSEPRGFNGFSGPNATTEIEIGKTANLYSESLRTMDMGRPLETMALSQELATQSWRSNEDAQRSQGARRQAETVGTEGTDYSEYTDGSYTTSGSEGESGSESDVSHDNRHRNRPQPNATDALPQ